MSSRRTFLKLFAGGLASIAVPLPENEAAPEDLALLDAALNDEWALAPESLKAPTKLQQVILRDPMQSVVDALKVATDITAQASQLAGGLPVERLPFIRRWSQQELREARMRGERLDTPSIIDVVPEGVDLELPQIPYMDFRLVGLDICTYDEEEQIKLTDFRAAGGANLFTTEEPIPVPRTPGPGLGLRHSPKIQFPNTLYMRAQGRGQIHICALVTRASDNVFGAPNYTGAWPVS